MRGIAFIGAAALVFSGSAAATVIDFEDLGVLVGTQITTAINGTQDSGGFTFGSPGADLHFHNENGVGDNGSTHMGAHGFVDFAPTGGGVFSLQSFSFNYFITDLGSIEVIGTLNGGGTVSQTFVTNGDVNTYETFVLNASFVNLTSVTFDSGAVNEIATNGFFADDIVVNESVPEPGTLALLGLALTGLTALRRRQ